MPTVPSYQPTESLRPIQSQGLSVRASAEDFGAATGRGLSSLGQGVVNAADAVRQVKALQDETVVRQARNGYMQGKDALLYDPENGYMFKQGQDALDGFDAYESGLGGLRREYSRNLTPSQRNLFVRTIAPLETDAKRTGMIHKGNALKSFVEQAARSGADNFKQQALLHYDDLELWNKYTAAGLSELRDLGDKQGWSPEQLKAEEQNYLSDARRQTALAIANDDPIAATEYALKHRDGMTAEDHQSLMRTLLPMASEVAAKDATLTRGTAGPSNSSGPRVIAGGDTTLSAIRKFEGFRPKPYWDTNAFRTGYGSDTVTHADGTVVRVEAGMHITLADAERDLKRRVTNIQDDISGEVGAEVWRSLPANTQAAITSVAYNYGGIGKGGANIAAAVKSGNPEVIANAIEGLSGHNGGINRRRRHAEAALARGDSASIGDVSFSPRVEKLLGELPANSAAQLREAARNGAVKIEAQHNAQVKAHRLAVVDDYKLRIATEDTMLTEQAILDDPVLDNGDKASLIKELKSQNALGSEARFLNSRISSGDDADLNPFNADDRKVGDKAYDTRISAVPEEQRQLAQSDFVAATGYVPKSLGTALRYGAAASDATQLSAGLSLADVIERASPRGFDAMEGSSAIRPRLDLYRHLVNDRGFGSKEAAMEILRRETEDSKRSREMLSTDARAFVKDLTVSDVTNSFDTAFTWEPGAGISPIASNALLAEYKAVAEEKFYQTGGDADAAKALALAELHRTWGVSNISGEAHVTRLPPERTYPAIGGSQDYLRTDALETARTWVSEAFPDRTVKNIFVMPDEQTRADITAGRPPRYRLFYTYDQDGFELADEVVGHWGVDAATQDEYRSRIRERFLGASRRNMAKTEKENAALAAGERAYDETVGPAWMKAKAREQAAERVRQSSDVMLDEVTVTAPAPEGDL